MLLYLGGLAVGCPCNLVLTVSTLLDVSKYTKKGKRTIRNRTAQREKRRGSVRRHTDILQPNHASVEVTRGYKTSTIVTENNGNKVDQGVVTYA
jgi:hypothetical protein